MNLKGLYDMVGYKPEKKSMGEIIEEQKFRKHMEQNSNNFCKRNRDKFAEEDDCYLNCPRYNPCPICDKCQNKASNLYVKCQVCKIPMCIHKYSDRKFMIRRNNFRIRPDESIKRNLKELF